MFLNERLQRLQEDFAVFDDPHERLTAVVDRARKTLPLPPADRIVPLLAFNLGVELAHLTVIAIALPTFWLVARAVGARRYRRQVLPVAAGILAVLGAIWMIERVGGVRLLGG